MKNRIDTINKNLDGKTFNYQGVLDKKPETKIIQDHIKDLHEIEKAHEIISKMAWKYADSNIQAKQVIRVIKKMEGVRDIANTFISTMK